MTYHIQKTPFHWDIQQDQNLFKFVKQNSHCTFIDWQAIATHLNIDPKICESYFQRNYKHLSADILNAKEIAVHDVGNLRMVTIKKYEWNEKQLIFLCYLAILFGKNWDIVQNLFEDVFPLEEGNFAYLSDLFEKQTKAIHLINSWSYIHDAVLLIVCQMYEESSEMDKIIPELMKLSFFPSLSWDSIISRYEYLKSHGIFNHIDQQFSIGLVKNDVICERLLKKLDILKMPVQINQNDVIPPFNIPESFTKEKAKDHAPPIRAIQKARPKSPIKLKTSEGTHRSWSSEEENYIRLNLHLSIKEFVEQFYETFEKLKKPSERRSRKSITDKLRKWKKANNVQIVQKGNRLCWTSKEIKLLLTKKSEQTVEDFYIKVFKPSFPERNLAAVQRKLIRIQQGQLD